MANCIVSARSRYWRTKRRTHAYPSNHLLERVERSARKPDVRVWLTGSAFLTLAVAAPVLGPAHAQSTEAVEPSVGATRQFGLGGHTCKQYDDMGRLFIYSEGIPSPAVVSWMQLSDNGRRANVPMPQELVEALPEIPGCLPGKHHAAMPGAKS